MGTLASIPSSFVANTRARSSEVNAKFSDVYNALAAGTYDHYINGLRYRRLSSSSITMTGSDCYLFAYHQIDSSTTYDLATSTARMIILDTLEIKSGGTLHIAPSAKVKII